MEIDAGTQESRPSIASFYKPETHKEVTEKEMEPSGRVYTVQSQNPVCEFENLKGLGAI